jgi:teichuronic acid biosynthesis glycosyltransferase TuaC
MQVLTVSTYFPNAADPQRAVFVKNLVRAMQQRCHVEVISPVPYAPPFDLKPKWRDLRTIPALENIDGINVVHPRFVVLPRLGWFSGFGYFLGVLRALRCQANSGRRIVVHAHCAYPDAVGVAIAARLLRLPYIVTAHGSDINVYAERPTLRFQIRWALRHAAGVIAVSGALQAKISRLLGAAKTPLSCIPCAAFDPRVFFPRSRLEARATLKVEPHARLVVFVGQLVPVKGVKYLINAWAELRRRGRLGGMDRLVLLGNGPCRFSLERQITGAGLAGSVQFAGTQNQIEVARWMAAASLLCLPSLNEGTPNVIVEALACGVPVVASRVGGVPDLIRQGENGLLVSPADNIALTDALERVLERDWDACAIADSVSNLTWRAIADRNYDFFRSLF